MIEAVEPPEVGRVGVRGLRTGEVYGDEPLALAVLLVEDLAAQFLGRLLCQRFLIIPTHHCLNLAAALNVVLYDRRLKRHLAGLEPPGPVREMLHEHRRPV